MKEAHDEERDEVLYAESDFTVVFKSGAVVHLKNVSLVIKIAGLNPRRYVFRRGVKEVSFTPHVGNLDSTVRLDESIDAIILESN